LPRHTFIVLSILLCSCYRAAPVDTAALVRELSSPSPPPTVAESAPCPLTEAEAVRIALERNPELRAGRLEARAAKADALQATAWSNPEFRYTTQQRDSDPDLDSQSRFSLRWEPPHPFVQSARNEAAEAEAAESGSIASGLEAAVRRDVRLAYTKALHDGHEARLGRQVAALRRGLADGMKAAADRGQIDPLEAARAQLRAFEAEEKARTAQDDEREALRWLANLLGRPGPVTLGPAAGLPTCPAPGPMPATDPAWEQHPALAKARHAHARAEAELRSEHARRIPWIRYVEAGYERDPRPESLSGIPQPARSGMVLGFGIDLPLFDFNRGGVAAAEARRARRAEQMKAAYASLVGTLRDSHARWMDRHERWERLVREARPLAETAVAKAREAAASGARPETDRVAAEERALELEKLILDAAAECAKAAIEAEWAGGR
jgi:cobalt-zinc-cadmium efflux system outer membrane protein